MPKAEESEFERTAPLTQKQEDLLLELFFQLSVTDRKRIIKLCRDFIKDAHPDR